MMPETTQQQEKNVNFITAVHDAHYNEDGSINAMVVFGDAVDSEGKPTLTPFTAMKNDPVDYGRTLYADLVAGKYGEVTPFTVTPEMLANARRDKHAEINRWRDTQENGNYPFELDGHRWDCGKITQARLSPVVAVAHAGLLPASFFWTDADNNDVPMTADKLIALEAAMQQQMVAEGFKIHERQRQMKEAVDAMTDYAAIQRYTPGWQTATGG
ncbi:DUF4376 domain-containing protein [Edwardsiella tarda]|uniref:DUF4376 domain-containing protein n=1 Tax=Edwardsiella tarda TaxID=636 RepID=UPI002443DFD6|nr:DUF4376 domain-containing protein [Edwardsiella tarda]WGE29408.1 DUF4376 domain-containing protein [Edwardsiella tarda]